MQKVLQFSLMAVIGLLICACSANNADSRLEQLEQQMQAQQVLDIRLGQVEGRLTEVESAIGDLRTQAATSSAKTSTAKPRPIQATKPTPPKQPQNTPLILPPMESKAEKNSTDIAKVATAPSTISTPSEPVTPYANDAEDAKKHSNAAFAPKGNGAKDPQDNNSTAYAPMTGGKWIAPDSSTPPRVSATPSAQDMEKPQTPTTKNAVNTQSTPPKPSVNAPTIQTPTSTPSTTEKPTYDKALALYEKHQYTPAIDAFQDFLQANPNSHLAPNAMYWLGECYYSSNRLDTAIMIFQDAAAKYPKHPKTAASLLKTGYAYARMNDWENAYFYWQLLLDDFPNSPPAALAKKRISESRLK